MNLGQFPNTRLRRNRTDSWIRDLVQENHLSVKDLIWPVFVIEGKGEKQEIDSMPGVYRYSIDLLVKEVLRAERLGIPAVAIFPVIDESLKTPKAREAYSPNNLVCRTVKAIKSATKNIGVICDIALDPYTTHGHDGIVRKGYVDNDETLKVLFEQAIVCARAGCDVVAPSDMMDGRVGVIREMLDMVELENVKILAYSAKYASSFYGPFRDAIGSSKNIKSLGKETYQMNPANSDEAMREIFLDIEEGADMVMVKPGIAYLDIVRRAKDNFDIPIFAYHVSGEYAMIKAAANNGWIDGQKVMLESMISFKRAGATAILTYCAVDIAEILIK